MQRTYLGIELGSTRIKSVLIDGGGGVLARGAHTWENRLENGLWTYAEADIWTGVRDSFSALVRAYREELDVAGMGVSGMMHGYLALDSEGNLLAPFRTWRNTNTGTAAERLTREFGFNIPMRWSAAHLYQAVLEDEAHVEGIAYLTTLAGYVHYKLTGERALGVGDASGMFPIDSATGSYNAAMLDRFDELVKEKGYPWRIRDVLPRVLPAGKRAGALTEAGAKLLDPTGRLKAGIPLCPPEGDAGTGMVATNSVAPRTGNVSAGTSVFAMAVLEKPLVKVYPEIDLVATPDGKPVAMAHCNNCTSDINAWTGLLAGFAKSVGREMRTEELMPLLFRESLAGDADCGGLTAYNYLSGEPVTGLAEGRPMLLREADGKLTLPNLMKALIYSSLAGLAIGMEILRGERVEIEEMVGHGGFFKTPEVGQRAMSAAVGTKVTVMKNAGEGGAWGIALLAAYRAEGEGAPLPEFLRKVFAGAERHTLSASEVERRDFASYLKRYKAYLSAERAAAEVKVCWKS